MERSQFSYFFLTPPHFFFCGPIWTNSPQVSCSFSGFGSSMARMLHDHPGERPGNSSGEEGGAVQVWRGPGTRKGWMLDDIVDDFRIEK